MWWDTPTIERTVTRQFVCSHLLPQEIERLDRSLGRGHALRETYWSWIEQKAKRLFLILLELGIPDQIFGIIDDSWDDGDLPIPSEHVGHLALAARPDEKLDRRFYHRQFYFLVRNLQQGDHVDFADPEIIPLEVVDRRPGIVQSPVDKVELASKPGVVMARRRVSLGSGSGQITPSEFQRELISLKKVQNSHVLSYFASYTHQGLGYIIFSPAWESSLKNVVATMPAMLKSLPRENRQRRFLDWIHCLVDSLCYIHSRGQSHGNIKPSSILIGKDLHVFYTDVSRLGVDLGSQPSASGFDKEAYDYVAPEQWYRPNRHGSFDTCQHKAASPASPVNAIFTTARSCPEKQPMATRVATPRLDAQAADIFSLGCVILEILGLVLKRQSKAFASHRATKHKTAGRGGAIPDSSFHQNMGQVESWIAGLAKEASKSEFRPIKGVVSVLELVTRMLSIIPYERPTAQEVEQRLYKILTEECGIPEPHCVHQYVNVDLGVDSLRLSHTEPLYIPGGSRRTSSGTWSIRHRRGSSSGNDMAFSGSSDTSSPPESGPGSLSPKLSKWRAWQTHPCSSKRGSIDRPQVI